MPLWGCLPVRWGSMFLLGGSLLGVGRHSGAACAYVIGFLGGGRSAPGVYRSLACMACALWAPCSLSIGCRLCRTVPGAPLTHAPLVSPCSQVNVPAHHLPPRLLIALPRACRSAPDYSIAFSRPPCRQVEVPAHHLPPRLLHHPLAARQLSCNQGRRCSDEPRRCLQRSRERLTARSRTRLGAVCRWTGWNHGGSRSGRRSRLVSGLMSWRPAAQRACSARCAVGGSMLIV